ncbi:hypothetical protein [Stenotrophomonas maltophilia]|uniref:hypothetical protein n=1 Tax=Stenotrophomonas maltophilia TaxID=40324 RepID=UPI0013DB759A|nr:hypothetical protein [Stenotrophomonas maltophilia]
MTTDNKTLAVDALYVLDGVVLNGRFSQCTVDEFDEAKEAMSELIRAVGRLERKAVEQARLTSSVFNSDLESVRAALARVKGESA